MGGRATSITFRLTQEERDAIQAFASRQPSPPTLSEAIRSLVLAGLRAAHPRPLTDLRAILREMDPEWTARKPRLGPPVKARTGARNPADEVLEEERGR